ncbi:hypothetical protein HZ326_31220 [Fusarium oxysporum f. sp. albedinis]|nr:hypothetical protein HZ326_31220 [Fusarium oxysporum f. sp. albedinis]
MLFSPFSFPSLLPLLLLLLLLLLQGKDPIRTIYFLDRETPPAQPTNQRFGLYPKFPSNSCVLSRMCLDRNLPIVPRNARYDAALRRLHTECVYARVCFLRKKHFAKGVRYL